MPNLTRRRFSDRVRTWIALRGAELAPGVEVNGRIWFHGGGRLRVGEGARLGGPEAPVELHAEGSGAITVGAGAEIGPGTSIEAQASVEIGEGARIGPYCKILDNHFHAVRGDRGQRPPSVPVVVEGGAVVGERAILLPGARVKAGQIVPPGAVLRGIPAAAGGRATPPVQPPSPPPGGNRLARALALLLGNPGEALRVGLALLRARRALRAAERGAGVRAYAALQVIREGTLRVGPRVSFVGGMLATRLAARQGATLSIGEACVFNYGASLEASVSVTIGRRCMFGSLVRLHDGEGGSGPIVIEDGVWLAHGVVVRPGVTVGAGSVVSAGSVVTKDVPPNSFAAGNPARAIALALAAPAPEARAR